MLGIKLNQEVVDRCVKALKALADLQASSRRRLVKETQDICDKCDGAYSALLARLQPVKAAYRDPARLAQELHALAGDAATRRAFKPEGLCSEIDQLLADFQSALSGIRYSVHFLAIGEIKDTLESMGNYDQALYHQYDGFMRRIGDLAVALDSAAPKERKVLVASVREAIATLEADLDASIKGMRSAKKRVVKRM